MSLLLGLLLGTGCALVWQSLVFPSQATTRGGRSFLRRHLDGAGLETLPTPAFVSACLGAGFVVALLTWSVTKAPPVALTAGVLVLIGPWWWLGARREKRLALRREEWPAVVDHLRSAVRAGLPLTEAMAQLATGGPASLRPSFAEFAADVRVSRSVPGALERLRRRLDDPVADRIMAAVLITREVGGSDVGEMLSTLAGFLRAEQRTRGELEARQSWTVNAARLAVAAPWVILVVLCLEPRVAAAYSRPAGVLVLVLGAVVALVSYRVMLRIARLEPVGGEGGAA